MPLYTEVYQSKLRDTYVKMFKILRTELTFVPGGNLLYLGLVTSGGILVLFFLVVTTVFIVCRIRGLENQKVQLA